MDKLSIPNWDVVAQWESASGIFRVQIVYPELDTPLQYALRGQSGIRVVMLDSGNPHCAFTSSSAAAQDLHELLGKAIISSERMAAVKR